VKKAFFTLCVVLLLVLSACQQPTLSPTPTLTPVPSETVTPTLHPIPTQVPSPTLIPSPRASITPGPSPTSTVMPPLAAHTWQSEGVLIMAGTRDLDARTPFGTTIDFLLLADGQLIVRNCIKDVCTFQTAQLEPKQMCALLNTLDQAGFYDYDPASFVSPQPSTHKVFIQVSAWRSLSIEVDQLDQWLSDPNWLDKQLNCKDCVEHPIILPALSTTYYLLKYYRPEGLVDYQPQKMAVFLSDPWIDGTPAPWLLDSPTLSDLYNRSRCPGSDQGQAVVLQGDESSRVSEYINQMLGDGFAPIFTEGQLKLQVVNQWLLPFENPAGCSSGSSQLTATPVPAQVYSLACSPADGLVPLISPTP
jgi:hypothetical protein